ncbi:MAG: transposase [Candidatus Rokubacteria bacterium]|nr:transposase [Candidatus Rokubacteria bacterium]
MAGRRGGVDLLQAGVVRFRWKDYNDGTRVKIMALPAEEFIRRFLLHIVPERFVRIRHFGFLANRSRPPAPPHRHRHRALPGPRPGPPRLGRDTSADPPDPRAGPGHLLMRAVTSDDRPIRPLAGSPSCAHDPSRASAIIPTSPLRASAPPPTPSHTLHRGARPTTPCHPSLISPTPPLR